MSDWSFLATIVAALLGVAGAIYGVRKTSKIDKEKLTQQWATIFGEERQNIALELKELKGQANEMSDQLRNTKEEYTASRIEHREAIAEKNATIRERDMTIQDLLVTQHRLQTTLEETTIEMLRCRHELVSARALIATMREYLQEYRASIIRLGGRVGPEIQVPEQHNIERNL